MNIISRAGWGARPPRDRTVTSWSTRTLFVVHYSAASPSQSPRVIQDYHMDTRGWDDIGYNFLVDEHGRIYEGRGWLVVGAHAKGHNTAGIGVCFIGRDRAGVVDAAPAARAAMRWLYDEACRLAGRRLTVRGHRDVGSTECPGDELYAWLRAGMPASGPAPTPATNWMEKLMQTLPELRRGAIGRSVTRAQALANVYGTGLTEDGNFGPATDSAVRQLQKRFGLDVDGIVGPKTWAALLTAA